MPENKLLCHVLALKLNAKALVNATTKLIWVESIIRDFEFLSNKYNAFSVTILLLHIFFANFVFHVPK
jgi:hypothetical protein